MDAPWRIGRGRPVVELVIECAGTRCRLRGLDGRGSVGDEIGLSWNDDDVLRLRE